MPSPAGISRIDSGPAQGIGRAATKQPDRLERATTLQATAMEGVNLLLLDLFLRVL